MSNENNNNGNYQLCNDVTCILIQPGTATKEYYFCDNLQQNMQWGNGYRKSDGVTLQILHLPIDPLMSTQLGHLLQIL
uniref:Uncharacterized protein n=1 Tax=Romanomermis culicivorax TaxID=13658 RepID=A0A915HPV0_ROMCU